SSPIHSQASSVDELVESARWSPTRRMAPHRRCHESEPVRLPRGRRSQRCSGRGLPQPLHRPRRGPGEWQAEGADGADPRTGKFAQSKASPPVIELDTRGSVVRAWGDPALVPAGTIGPAGNNIGGQNAVLPNGTHGCFVDYEDNIWLGGNGDGVVQKWSHDGSTLLLQIG